MMSTRDRLTAGLRRAGLAQPAPPPEPIPMPPGGAQALEAAGLLEHRAALAARFAQLQWDLGGLTYEMAIRDSFRNDLLLARAAELQEVDTQLAEVERLLQLEQAAAAGACPSCGSLYAQGAAFCWSCGLQLLAPAAAPGQGRS
jgi:hypothetical protein